METVWTAHGQGLKEIPENTCSDILGHIIAVQGKFMVKLL